MFFVLLFFLFEGVVTFILKDYIPNPEAYGMLLLLMSIAAVSLYLFRILEKEWLLLIFAGFAVRVAVLFIDLYVPALPIFSSGTDTEYFHTVSLAIAEGHYPLADGATAYVPFLSGIYYLFGDQRPFAQFLNVAFWVFSAVYLLKALKLLDIERHITLFVLLIFAFMPNSIFMSSILLREAIIIFFISVSLYCFVRWFVRGDVPAFIYAVILAVMAMIFHSGMIGFVIAYMLAFFFVSRREKGGGKAGQAVLYTLFFALLAFVMLQNAELFLSKFTDLQEGGVSALEISGRGGSMYLESFNGLSGIAALLVAPLKMFYFLFSPLPLDWRGMGDIISFLMDSSFYLFLIGMTVAGLWKSEMPVRHKLLVLLFLIVTVLVYSYGTQSAGTAMRHRNKMVPLLLILYAMTVSRRLFSGRLPGKGGEAA